MLCSHFHRHQPPPGAVWPIPNRIAFLFLFWMLSLSASARGGPSSSTPRALLDLLRPTPVQFAPEERAALRGAFLRKFGLQALEPAMNGGGERRGSAKVPAHIWALYERHRARPEADIVRHYAPAATYFGKEDESGTTTWWMVYNLSATGREPERVSTFWPLRDGWPKQNSEHKFGLSDLTDPVQNSRSKFGR